jgi:[acyl-carrier-protein] S-malonyltransferase
MARLAAVFVNEGSHYVGMGKDFYDRSLSARKFFDDAEKILNVKVAKLFFLGPKEEQDLIANAHYAALVNAVAAWELLVTNRRRAEVLTGVGIGEVAAAVAAECIPYEPALKFVYARALWISQTVGTLTGRSLTVSGLTEEQLLPSLSREEGEIHVTHRLSPDTFVVWGPQEAADVLALELQGAPGVKVMPATTRGPLHTSLAADWEGDFERILDECLEGKPFKHPKATLHRVFDGEYLGTPEMVRENILQQYSRCVNWTGTVRALIDRGFRTWVELGPGKTYGTLVKKIDTNTRVANVEDIKSLGTAIKVTM